jgi:hypothetical protein
VTVWLLTVGISWMGALEPSVPVAAYADYATCHDHGRDWQDREDRYAKRVAGVVGLAGFRNGRHWLCMPSTPENAAAVLAKWGVAPQ